MVAFNKTLGRFQLVSIPPAPRGRAADRGHVRHRRERDHRHLAKDLGTGNERRFQIEGGSGLNEDEVERMVKEAESHRDEAHKLRELADAHNLAEQLAYQTERTLKEHRDKLESRGLDDRRPDHGLKGVLEART